ncbi:hypothetical protein [Pseudomonas rhodesiae]|uniref:hypothetical protein n=1 Tax=Pseudomonas rhodesiae TaxID=76760 RepID=UPI00058FC3A7|nr:hypothetical protein [Pseudomonas rhodesiae]
MQPQSVLLIQCTVPCSEQVCIKGDDERLERLARQREGIRMQLEKVRRADEEGMYGSDRWSVHQHKTLERVNQLIAILESPNTPMGSVIRLSNDQAFSPLKRALAAHSDAPKLAATMQLYAPSHDELISPLRGGNG